MSEALILPLIDKLDAHERKIHELHQILEQTEQYANTLHHINSKVDEIKDSIQQANFPVKEMQQLSMCLKANLQHLKHPLRQEVVHQHHATKIIWATGALFIIVCLLLTSWYNTADKLDLYKASDTKYRYLKLQSNTTLWQWCRDTDSLYTVDENLRVTVLAQEEEKQRNIETLQRAREMEEEARKLKEQVNNRSDNEK